MLMILNTPKGEVQIVDKSVRYSGGPPRGTSEILFRWVECHDLQEAQENTNWLLTQLSQIPSLLPLDQ